jgi:hypothetical protein
MKIPDTIPAVHEPSARSDAACATAVDTASVAGGNGVPPRGWRPMPGELVSLWDMLRIYAETFLRLTTALAEMRHMLSGMPEHMAGVLQKLGIDPGQVDSPFAGGKRDWRAKEHPARATAKKGLDAGWAKFLPQADQLLGSIAEDCVLLELRVALAKAESIRRGLSSVTNSTELARDIKDLEERVRHELQAEMFFFVPPHRAEYWSESPLFGEKVQRRYRKAVDDMVEAGKCLAAGRFTACVFHLMRVVEVGAKRLAKTTLKLTISHRATLGGVAVTISKEVANWPATTQKESERKTAFSKAAAHLSNITDGWRNKTMHPGENYGEDEARLMFQNVREFMNLLVDLR